MSSGVDLDLHVVVLFLVLGAGTFDFKLELGWLALTEVVFEHADDLVKLNSLFTAQDFLQFTIQDDIETII